MAKDIFRIPQFLSAKTPEELVMTCLAHQRLNDKMYEYQIVFAKGIWFAWYHSDVMNNLPLPKKIAKVANEN